MLVLILLRRWRLTMVAPVFLLAAPGLALAQMHQKAAPYAHVEMLISGPSSMPLHRQRHGEKFTVILINRDAKPISIVPPHRDWPEETWTAWNAKDARGRYVSRIPRYEIYCIGTTMYEKTIFTPPPLDPSHPKTIEASDVVILQPGEEYEFQGIADPSSSLNFPRTGTYQIMMSYQFYPEHYATSKGSKKAAFVKNAPSISVTSNTLTLVLE
ncbi:MAG TPA: hypothetical protein VJW94_09560 [Candidatus Acidoferrum sp.]|nr:hypothetical protein [Candidatus Acidoferrum sp.]